MKILQTEDGKKGRFYIEENGFEIAKMEYVYVGADKFIIDHTEVNVTHEGKGLGRELVQAGVQYARKHKIKIIPLCPYAKAVFIKVPAYADVLF